MFTFDSLEPGEVEGERQLRGRPGHQQGQDQEAGERQKSVQVSARQPTLDTYMLELEVGRVWPMSPPSARCAVVSTASSLLRPAPPLASRYHPALTRHQHANTCTASLPQQYLHGWCLILCSRMHHHSVQRIQSSTDIFS